MGTRIVDPLYKEKKTGSKYLAGLLGQTVPLRETAPLGETEQFLQDELGRFVRTPLPTGAKTSHEYFTNIIDKPVDLTTMPEYQAVLSSIGSQTSDQVNRELRRTQNLGMGTSGAQSQGVGKQIALGGERMLASLLPVAMEERARQERAATALPQVAQIMEALQGGRFNLAGFAGLPRSIQQQVLNSIFEQEMSPFTTKAAAAQGAQGGNVNTLFEDKGSTWEAIMPLIASIGIGLMTGGAGGAVAGGLLASQQKPPSTFVPTGGMTR